MGPFTDKWVAPGRTVPATRLRIAVLVASHNRCALTVRAVRSLECARRLADIQLVLFDDASTDGTAAAVAEADPQAIILRGDGQAFWNGGLYRAWDHARTLGADAYLWLNDDVVLDEGGVARLLDAYAKMTVERGNRRFILVGATRNVAGTLTYSGRRYGAHPIVFRLDIVRPDEAALLPIDTFNGNIVLVPHEVVDEIGTNDRRFRHGLGDYEYGLRASRLGIAVRLMPGTLGVCEANDSMRSRGYGGRDLSLWQQWKVVNTPKGFPFRDWLHLTRGYSGPLWPLHFIMPYRFLVLPRIFRRR